MKFYVISNEGFGTDSSAKRTILAFKDESEVTDAAKKYGTQLTEQQYRDIFREQYHTSPDIYLRNLRGAFKFRILAIRVNTGKDDERHMIFCTPMSDILPLMRDGITARQLEIETGFHQTELGNAAPLHELANREDLFKYAADYDAVRQASDFLYKLEYADLIGTESAYFPKTNCRVKRSQRVLNDFYEAIRKKEERWNKFFMVRMRIFYRKHTRNMVERGFMKKRPV